MGLQCSNCGKELTILRRPLHRLRWSKYWWRGLASFFGNPLKVCTKCGAIYTYRGDLVAAGAAETDAELRIHGFKKDMIILRDSFATIVLGGEIGAIWTLFYPGGYELSVTVALIAVGAGALIPTSYFAKQVRMAKRDIKALKRARNQLEDGK